MELPVFMSPSLVFGLLMVDDNFGEIKALRQARGRLASSRIAPANELRLNEESSGKSALITAATTKCTKSGWQQTLSVSRRRALNLPRRGEEGRCERRKACE